MKRKRLTEEPTIGALVRHEASLSVANTCLDPGIAHGTFYRWKTKYGGMGVSEARRSKELESVTTRLKQMLYDTSLNNTAFKEVLSINF